MIVLGSIAPPSGQPFLEVQDEVLGHGFSASRYRPRVKKWLNEGWRRICRRGTIVVGEEIVVPLTEAGDAFIFQPADLVRMESISSAGSDPRLQPILPITAAEVDRLELTEGRPRFYCMERDFIRFWPTPDTQMQLLLRYWRTPPNLVNDEDRSPFPEEYDRVAVDYALCQAYQAEHDREFALHHKAEYMDGLMQIQTDLSYRDPKLRRRVPGMLARWGPMDEHARTDVF